MSRTITTEDALRMMKKIGGSGSEYVLPLATNDALGGVKIGYTESGKNYPVELNSSGQMYVNVPWENTIYTLGSFGITATASELNKLDGCTATVTELNYVDGVTSNIQTQLNGKVPTSRTINGKALTGNITLSASDVGAAASSHSHSNYVALTTAQTITGVKTFNASNIFTGEQKFTHPTYCASITDSASGIGCAFKASRGLFNEALVDKLIMTASTGKMPFYKYTGTSGGSMTGLTEVGYVTGDGEIVSKCANAFRSIQGNYGFFIRNDGSNLYFMLTSSGNPTGGWSSLRPFTISFSSGQISSQPTYDNTVTYATNMYVGNTGRLTRTTNTSSRTIKHDIKELSSQDLVAENLYNLNVVQFKYDDGIVTDENDARYGKDLVGFIIEDMNEIYPIAVDKPTDDVKEWSWNAQYLIPPMLKLIQDLHKEIEALKERVS